MKARQLEIVSVVESCVAFLVGAVLAARKRTSRVDWLPSLLSEATEPKRPCSRCRHLNMWREH